MRLRPTVEEERRLSLARRLGEDVTATARELGWKSTTRFPRIALFVLTLIGVLAVWGVLGLFDILEWRSAQLVAGILALAGGELLIEGSRFFRHGVEEALWLAGPALIVTSSGEGSEVAGLAALGVAAAISAVRLLNPWMGVLSAACFAASLSEWSNEAILGWVALGGAIIVALIVTREQKRPFHARLAELLTIGLFAVAGAMLSDEGRGPLIALSLAAVLLVGIGLQRRVLAPLLAVIAGGGFILDGISGRIDWGPELEAFLWGALLLVAGYLASVALGGRRAGVTADRIGKDADEEIAEALAVVSMTPGARGPGGGGSEADPGGGDFGGGGATERW